MRRYRNNNITKGVKNIHSLLTILLAAIILASCSSDETIPPLTTNLLMATINSEGYVSDVLIDDGSAYHLTAQQIQTNKRDTTLRCIGVYTIDDEGIRFADLEAIFCQEALPDSAFKSTPHDPVKLISIWRSANYLNLTIGQMTTGAASHAYAFCEDSLQHYSLLHKQPENDPQSYTAKVVMSMPIPSDEPFTFTINTYEGNKTYHIDSQKLQEISQQ